jgi:hypothetical protein
VRFYPEGNEGDDDKDAAAQKVIDDAAKAEFDKERQKADQAEANARKAKAEAATANEALEAERQASAALKQQLADAEAKAAAAGISKAPDLKEEDYEGGDKDIVKAVNALKEQIVQKDKDIATLKKTAADFRKEVQTEQARKNSDAAFEELLSDLDGEYGADNRNAALAKWKVLREEGKVPKGKPAMATRLMQKCYKDAKVEAEAAKTEAEKKGVKLDSGSGGGQGGPLSRVKITPGQSLEDAVKQVAAATSK